MNICIRKVWLPKSKNWEPQLQQFSLLLPLLFPPTSLGTVQFFVFVLPVETLTPRTGRFSLGSQRPVPAPAMRQSDNHCQRKSHNI
uniref:Uncharacterized protein n=1 Tax=Tetraselmis sp. GSL018 TaxID=582737 RepID=A0A061QPQ4_9CHLO